jgi:hypothetical protein
VPSARTLAARHTADDERTLSTILTAAALGALEIAPGVYRLADEHHIYAVPSASTDRIHQVTVNTRTGAMRCDGPHCDGRTCSHQKRVLKARAEF